MNKTFNVLMALVAVTAFSGCNKNGALGEALEAAQKNDLKTFQENATGAALERYGSEAGFAELRQKVAGASDFKVSDEKLVSSKQGDQGFGQYGDVLRVFESQVSATRTDGTKGSFAVATLDCKVRAVPDNTGNPGCHTISGPPPHPPCVPGPIGQPRYVEMQNCKLSNLTF